MSAATLSAGLPAADPGEAAGLPGAAYTSADFLEMERRRVFRPAWIGVAPEDRVAAPGSVCPVSAAGQPLLLVRGERGELRVFHNVCRHRGTLLATAPGRCRSIVCPYHGWTYGLDGGLRETPHFEGFGAHGHGNLDPARHGLIPVRSGVWNRVVFVNLSGDAPPLDVWIAPLARRWAHFDFSLLRHGPGVSHELPVNWKTATENFLESYHLPVVHRTLNRYSALEHHNLVLESETFFGQQSTRYAPRDGAAGQLPVFPGLSDVQAGRAEYLCLFPNVWVSCVRDHFRVSFVEPVAPERTRICWEFFFVGDAAMAPGLRAAREALVERIMAVFEEDVEVLRRLQAGRASWAFDGGRFSPHHERAVHRFLHMVAARVRAGE